MKQFLVLIFSVIFLFSCSNSSVNDKINKVGEVVGEAGGHLAKGIGNGATQAFEVKIDLPLNLKEQGLSFGKITVGNDTSGNDNLLSVYFIFAKDFSGNLTAKVFDNKSMEMGRANILVEGKMNEAKFFDFHFDKRTNIDSDCKLTIE